MSTIVFDIDGVLADHRHRMHCIEKIPKRWEEYYDDMIYDPPFEGMIKMAMLFSATKNNVLLTTGRPCKYRTRTENWLMGHGGNRSFFDYLYMRAEGDFRPNPAVKEDFAQTINFHYGYIDMVFEDDPRSVEIWKKYSRQVCQVFNR